MVRLPLGKQASPMYVCLYVTLGQRRSARPPLATLLGVTRQLVDHGSFFSRRSSLGRLESCQVNRFVLLNDAEQRPTFESTQRTTLANLYRIADSRFVVLVMDVKHRASLDELAVLGVLDGAVEFNPPRLGRFVTSYYTYYNSRWHVRLPRSLQS